jgi:predicted short-subunit dehydrogenase-like oxidoreductase (DUF2520 family)
MSFSFKDDVNWDELPLLLEVNKKENKIALTKLATTFSSEYSFMNSKERLAYHVSAVFVNNFVNALHVSAEAILQHKIKNGKASYLNKLSILTLEKIFNHGAAKSQTGPAQRGDSATIAKHKAFLKGDKSLSKVYSKLSELIKIQSDKRKL